MSPTKGVMALLLVLALLVCCAHGIDKENFLKYLSAREDISDRCQTHLDALVKGLESGSSWAWSSKYCKLEFLVVFGLLKLL